jgi:electron transfer flavoprotein alpha subunit
MKAAVVLFTDDISVQQQAGEINAVLSTMETAFSRLELWLFDPGCPPEAVPEISQEVSAIKRVTVGHGGHLPEPCLASLMQLCQLCPMDLLVFASNGWGAELATRLGYRLQGSSCLKVEACRVTSTGLEVTKPVYGNHLSARFLLSSPPYCLSVAKCACRPARLTGYKFLEIENVALIPAQYPWVLETVILSDPPDNGLAQADRVLVVGQGVQSKETMAALYPIAEILGAEIGASRPVVMNAWVDMKRLIGASGLILSPKLCIAAGVSGSAVFRAGIQHSELIVAINTDGHAPIFQIAHVGIVGDLMEILSELAKGIAAEKEKKKRQRPSVPASKTP